MVRLLWDRFNFVVAEMTIAIGYVVYSYMRDELSYMGYVRLIRTFVSYIVHVPGSIRALVSYIRVMYVRWRPVELNILEY